MITGKNTITLLIISLLLLVGCSSKQVSIVKDGSFQRYPQLKIGKFLENVKDFSKTEWKYEETEKGEKVVSFWGKFDLKDFLLLQEMWEIKLVIQFHFDADGEYFRTGYSSLVCKRKNLSKNKLFILTNTNSDEEIFLYENQLSLLLDGAFNENLKSEYILDIQNKMLGRGLKQALLNISVSDFRLLESYGLDILPVGRIFESYLETAIKENSQEKLTLLAEIGFNFKSKTSINKIKEMFDSSVNVVFEKHFKELIFVVENEIFDIGLLNDRLLSRHFEFAVRSKSIENIKIFKENGYDITSKSAHRSIMNVIDDICTGLTEDVNILKFIYENNLIDLKRIVFYNPKRSGSYIPKFPVDLVFYDFFSWGPDTINLELLKYYIEIGVNSTSRYKKYIKYLDKFAYRNEENLKSIENYAYNNNEEYKKDLDNYADQKNKIIEIRKLVKQLNQVNIQNVENDYKTNGGLYEFN